MNEAKFNMGKIEGDSFVRNFKMNDDVFYEQKGFFVDNWLKDGTYWFKNE